MKAINQYLVMDLISEQKVKMMQMNKRELKTARKTEGSILSTLC